MDVDVDLAKNATTIIKNIKGDTFEHEVKVVVIDSCEHYIELMRKLFDFN